MDLATNGWQGGDLIDVGPVQEDHHSLNLVWSSCIDFLDPLHDKGVGSEKNCGCGHVGAKTGKARTNFSTFTVSLASTYSI